MARCRMRREGDMTEDTRVRCRDCRHRTGTIKVNDRRIVQGAEIKKAHIDTLCNINTDETES